MVGRHTDTPHIIVFGNTTQFSPLFCKGGLWVETRAKTKPWRSEGFGRFAWANRVFSCSAVVSPPHRGSQRSNPFLTTRHWLNSPLWHLHLKLVPPNGLMYSVIALQTQTLSSCRFVSTSAEEVTFPPLSVGWLLCVQDDEKLLDGFHKTWREGGWGMDQGRTH